MCMNCMNVNGKHPPQGIRQHRCTAVGGHVVSPIPEAPLHMPGIASKRLFSQLRAPKGSSLALRCLIQLLFPSPISEVALTIQNGRVRIWLWFAYPGFAATHGNTVLPAPASRVCHLWSTLLSLISSLAKTCLRTTSGMFPRPRFWHLPQLRIRHQRTFNGF